MKPILDALFALCDTVKNLDKRVKFMEHYVNRTGTGSPNASAPCRHDMIWEELNRAGMALRPIETDCPNCNLGPLEHGRADCPRCGGTGKVELL